MCASQIGPSASQYFAYFDQSMQKKLISNDYSQLFIYYKGLKQSFIEISEGMDKVTTLKQFAELLDIDAQLQLLKLWSDNLEKFPYAQEEIIKIILNDKGVYYKELLGVSMDQDELNILIYLSDSIQVNK